MTKEETVKEIANKINEIRDMYYKAYPNGDSLKMCIWKDVIMFNNIYWNKDKEFPIDYFEKSKARGSEDDSERI